MNRAGRPPPTAARVLQHSRWALLFGNFAIGCGVMVTLGSLNALSLDLGISVAQGGQLIALAGVAMALSAPLSAGWVASLDRRRLLTAALLWYALGHAACALAPDFARLLPLRILTVLSASLFTPQAAAALGVMAPPGERSGAIGFAFLGWALALVLGLPLHSWLGETQGWRWAFVLVAGLAAVAGLAVWRALPDGVRPAPIGAPAWKALLQQPGLMAVIAVTALQQAGQFSVQAYLVPYARQVLGADAASLSLLFLWIGGCGLLGSLALARRVDRLGPVRAVHLALGGIALGLLLWPLAGSTAGLGLLILPWALAGLALNAAQQARLHAAAPALAPALLALNSSAAYLGHATGAAGGGALVAALDGYAGLAPLGLLWIVGALGLSHWAQRRLAASPGGPPQA